jgi:hypothetical protein
VRFQSGVDDLPKSFREKENDVHTHNESAEIWEDSRQPKEQLMRMLAASESTNFDNTVMTMNEFGKLPIDPYGGGKQSVFDELQKRIEPNAATLGSDVEFPPTLNLEKSDNV